LGCERLAVEINLDEALLGFSSVCRRPQRESAAVRQCVCDQLRVGALARCQQNEGAPQLFSRTPPCNVAIAWRHSHIWVSSIINHTQCRRTKTAHPNRPILGSVARNEPFGWRE